MEEVKPSKRTTPKKSAAQREAEAEETMEMEWYGHTFSLPSTADDWDINVTRKFGEGDDVGAIIDLIGASNFAKIEAAHRAANDGRFRNRDLKPLAEKIANAYGFDTSGE